MKNRCESPSKIIKDIRLSATIAALTIGIIGCINPFSDRITTEYVDTRKVYIAGTATAQPRDDTLLSSPNVLSTREAIVKLLFEIGNPDEDNEVESMQCTGTILEVGTDDLDNNPETPEDVVALFLTVSHCVKNMNEDFYIYTDNSTTKASVIEQRILETTFNSRNENPVLLKAKIENSSTKIHPVSTDTVLVGGTNINNTVVISCGYDLGITPVFPKNIYDQYCDYGIAATALSGLTRVDGLMTTFAHSGGPGINEEGNINSVAVAVPENASTPDSYFVPLTSDAESARQEMFP